MKGKAIAVENVRITVLVPDGLAVLELVDRRVVALGDVIDGDLGSPGAARMLNERADRVRRLYRGFYLAGG